MIIACLHKPTVAPPCRANVLLRFLEANRVAIAKYGAHELMHIPPQLEFAIDEEGTTVPYNWNDYEHNKGFMPASKAYEILTFLQNTSNALHELERIIIELCATTTMTTTAMEDKLHQHDTPMTVAAREIRWCGCCAM